MEQRARLKVNLAQREFEIEGSEEFVRSYAPRIEAMLTLLDEATSASEPQERSYAPMPQANGSTAAMPSYGEYIQRLPVTSTDVDRMLASGYYVQASSTDDSFATGEANRRLTEQGIKVGNPSQCVKQSLLAKRVFAINRGRYRVSQQGRQHLRQLLGTMLPDLEPSPGSA